jgi:hypothetical protein
MKIIMNLTFRFHVLFYGVNLVRLTINKFFHNLIFYTETFTHLYYQYSTQPCHYDNAPIFHISQIFFLSTRLIVLKGCNIE